MVDNRGKFQQEITEQQEVIPGRINDPLVEENVIVKPDPFTPQAWAKIGQGYRVHHVPHMTWEEEARQSGVPPGLCTTEAQFRALQNFLVRNSLPGHMPISSNLAGPSQRAMSGPTRDLEYIEPTSVRQRVYSYRSHRSTSRRSERHKTPSSTPDSSSSTSHEEHSKKTIKNIDDRIKKSLETFLSAKTGSVVSSNLSLHEQQAREQNMPSSVQMNLPTEIIDHTSDVQFLCCKSKTIIFIDLEAEETNN